MYCKKCEKSLPEGSTFCPYCGNEQLEAEEPKAEETVEEAVEEAAEEVAQETATEEAPEEVAVKDGDRFVEGKSGKGLIIGLLVVIIAMLAVSVVMLAVKLFGGEGTPAITEGPAVTENETPSDTGLFPDEYTLAYPEGIDYSALNIEEYIALGNYENLTLTLTTSSEITDEDVAEYIDTQLALYATEEEVTDRAAKEGDIVNINYVGTVDGIAFDGGSAAGATVVIGAGGYIDGFEDGIIGMNIGEARTIDVTFPENYSSTDLAGKDAQFEITLNSIKEEVIPEYNDAFVRDNFDMDTIPEFEADVRELLAEERESEILAEKQSGLFAQVVDGATAIKYPEGLVEDYMYQQIDSTKFYGAMYYGMEYSEFVSAAFGISAEEYEAEVREDSKFSIKQELVLFAILEAAGLEISDSDIQEVVDTYLAEYDAEDIAQLCETLGISEEYFGNAVNFAATYNKVMDYLVDNATFTGAK